MINERTARAMFGLTSLMVFAGLVMGLVLAIGNDEGRFDTTGGRILNFFSFFTVQSNICVAVTTGMLALRLHRPSTVFRVFRLVGVIAISVTGIVFHLALADLQELTGWNLVMDTILHTLSPILAAVGWLVFGPRDQLTRRVVGLAALPAIGWLAYALTYGALVTDVDGRHYYAYPFMDVGVHGYAIALSRCALVAVLFLAIGFGAHALDKRLPTLRLRSVAPAT